MTLFNHVIIRPEVTGSKQTHWSMNRMIVLIICACFTNGGKDMAPQRQIWSTCGSVKPKFKAELGFWFLCESLVSYDFPFFLSHLNKVEKKWCVQFIWNQCRGNRDICINNDVSLPQRIIAFRSRCIIGSWDMRKWSVAFYARMFETIMYWYLNRMSYSTPHEVGPVQIIKYVEWSRFQAILKLEATSCFKSLHFKAIILLAIFTNSDLWQNEGAFHISNYWPCLNIDHVVWFVLKVIYKILLMADVSFT